MYQKQKMTFIPVYPMINGICSDIVLYHNYDINYDILFHHFI